MNLKVYFVALVYFILFLFNVISIVLSVEKFDNIIPFILIFSTFLVTSFLLLLLQYIKTLSSNKFTAYAEKIINNGQQIIYITVLGIFDLILFILIAPDLVTQLEVEFKIPILFYALFYFLVPIILFRIFVDPVGIKFESLFWNEFQYRIQDDYQNAKKIVPSASFCNYILHQIYIRHQKTQSNSRPSRNLNNRDYSHQNAQRSYQMLDTPSHDEVDEVILTSYPVTEEKRNLEFIPNQSLLSSESPQQGQEQEQKQKQDERNPYLVYHNELLDWFPNLKPFVERDPVSLRAQLLLEIIITQTMNDPRVYQFFKNHSL